jgi:glycosyltransferase involved in cell wall biosynthesis
MLRVLIPALQVGPGQTGVGGYTLELVRGMISQVQPDDEEIIVAAPQLEAFAFLAGRPGFRTEKISLPAAGPGGRMMAIHTRVPALGQRLGVDVVLAPNFIAPVWGRFATAATVHDLTFLRFPKTTPLAKRLYYTAAVRLTLRRAARIFVDSRTIADEVVDFAPHVAEKLRLAPLGVAPAYLENGDRAGSPAPSVQRARRDHFLFVGTLEPRKNLVRLLIAHGNQCRGDPLFPELRLVGGRGWRDEGIRRALASHPDPSRVLRLGYRDVAELRAEYDTALALLFPSLYEGFGLPVVEAMARGCPVLTSRGIATEEVAGGAALLVDPSDGEELERGMRRLVDDPGLRRRLADAGHVRAREFSWERCARATLDGLRELRAGGRTP